MKIHYTAALRRQILNVWERNFGDDAGPGDGTHAWIRQGGSNWVTVEAEDSEAEPVVIVSLVSKVDALGYPMGELFTSDILHQEEINEIAAHTRIPVKA